MTIHEVMNIRNVLTRRVLLGWPGSGRRAPRRRHFAASAYTGGFDPFARGGAAGRRILVTGGTGQIGVELVPRLRQAYGRANVFNSDIKRLDDQDGPFVYCDVQCPDTLARVTLENGIDTIIHLASLLSAIGERNPQLAIRVNTRGIENVLELAKVNQLSVFSPSTIAVYGPTTPRTMTPDCTIMRPTTIYGITKVNLELLGEYYHAKFGVDFRSIRLPGIISSEAWPGGGTTDYAVEIFYDALLHGQYKCYLSPDVKLPMLYMPDCLDAMLGLLEAPAASLHQRVYNVAAFSVTPRMLEVAIQRRMPEFRMDYVVDFRQEIARTWPESIDDAMARRDWDWTPVFDLEGVVDDMLTTLSLKLKAAGKSVWAFDERPRL